VNLCLIKFIFISYKRKRIQSVREAFIQSGKLASMVKLSHPSKVLIRSIQLTKEELALYYSAVDVDLMRYSKGRPLSFKRYPDGYPGKGFFQRNRPAYAPSWIESAPLGLKKKADYILPTSIEVIQWLVNIDALEFHVAQTRRPHLMLPDMLVFDLDPPHREDLALFEDFERVRDLALEIKPIIEGYGYTPFVKTSGKKGVHLFCPLKSGFSYDEVFEAAHEIGEEIVGKLKNVTLKIAKEARRDKILIDIYRNHTLQSMAMPYGLRATSYGTVSMPLDWSKLESTTSPKQFTLRTVPEILRSEGDAWEKLSTNKVDLHTSK